MNMKRFEGKKVIVTGGNSGIGYATARLFTREGADVIITGRREKAVSKSATELGVAGMVADQSHMEDIHRLSEEVKFRFGNVDVLFINAGVPSSKLIEKTTESEFDDVIGVNFKGAYFTLSRFIPFLNNGASVTFLSSIGARLGQPGGSLYGAGKAAVNSLVKTAAMELASRQIRVNSVSPGPVQTPIFTKAGLKEGHTDALNKRIPLSRMGRAEEIAELVAYISSEKASFITGSDVVIDGGTGINSITGHAV